MAWVEMIKIRAAGNKDLEADDNIPEIIDNIRPLSGLADILYFEHGNVPGDRLIILKWQTIHPPILGSELSHGLMQELKRYGPVDYSVWVEKGV